MQKCDGITHNCLTSNNARKLLPEIIKIIEKLRSINVSKYKKFGLLNEKGEGQYESWRSALIFFDNHKFPEIDFEKLFKHSLLTKKKYEFYVRKMFNLFSFCPEEKHIIHGDFGFDNLIVNDGKITAVLDWAESRYGDFLYDIAWLDFWSNDVNYAYAFGQYYLENNIDVPYFKERIRCYRLHIGLSGLILSAHLNNEKDFALVEKRLRR